MELQDYLTIVWRRKWVILCTFLVTSASVIYFTIKTPPVYTASAFLRIATSTTGSVNYSYVDRLTNTYVKLATTKPVLDELNQQIGLTNTPNIEVTIVPNTELLQIRVQDRNPILAAEIANTLADILISQSLDLYTGSGQSSLEILNKQLDEMENQLNQAREEYMELVAQNPEDAIVVQLAKQSLDVKQQIYDGILQNYEQTRINTALRENSIKIVDPAIPPVSPSNSNAMRNIVLGCLVGLVGGLGLAFLFENLDTTLYSLKQIEDATNLPVLGKIPGTNIRKHLNSSNGNNAFIDAYRRLKLNLFAFLRGLPHQTFVITSPEPGEGKSTIVINLANVLSKAGKKVVVIDCDLRKPTLHKILKLKNEHGLSNYLNEMVDFEEILQNTKDPNVKIITSGPLPSTPAELLGSQLMKNLLDQLRQSWDCILLDTPALLSVPDTIVLVPFVDSVIMVVSQSHSKRGSVQNACKQLSDIGAHILGIVVNRTEGNRDYYYKKSKRVI